MRYTARARPVGRVWHVEVPQIARATQAKKAGDVVVMAADLIECVTDESVSVDDIDVEFEVPEEVLIHLRRLERARASEKSARAETVREQVAAAAAMTSLGFTRRDAGAVLGISHQRVQQLIGGRKNFATTTSAGGSGLPLNLGQPSAVVDSRARIAQVDVTDTSGAVAGDTSRADAPTAPVHDERAKSFHKKRASTADVRD